MGPGDKPRDDTRGVDCTRIELAWGQAQTGRYLADANQATKARLPTLMCYDMANDAREPETDLFGEPITRPSSRKRARSNTSTASASTAQPARGPSNTTGVATKQSGLCAIAICKKAWSHFRMFKLFALILGLFTALGVAYNLSLIHI